MKFVYKALANGTLSNPYRYVEKDAIVTSDIEIIRDWLTPVINGVPQKVNPDLPQMSHMKAPAKKADGLSLHRAVDPIYDSHINVLKGVKEQNAAAAISVADDSQTKIIQAIATLNPENQAEYTKSGKPDAGVLTELVGFQVTAKARDAAFDLFSKEKAESPIADVSGTGNQDVLG